MIRKLILFIIASIITITTQAITLKASDYGDRWPLTLQNGTADCISNIYVVFISDGITYAVNGAARGMIKEKGWRDIKDVQLKYDHMDKHLSKVDINIILGAGLKECKP